MKHIPHINKLLPVS